MKKKILGVCVFLISGFALTNCNNPQKKQSGNANADQQISRVLKTLNGFDSTVAVGMISNFKSNYQMDTEKKSAYAWYSAADISSMYNLLTTENPLPNGDTITGVRIYFGCEEKPPVSPGTKLKIHMFIVSTRNRTANDPPNTGADTKNIDYYDHVANYLTATTTTFGDVIKDNAHNAYLNGAYLYSKDLSVVRGNFPPDTCNDVDPHYIDNEKALTWVQKRGDGETDSSEASSYSTRSEWFDIHFIKKFFKIIADTTSNKFSGLRIYLGKGQTPKYGYRDVFILVPTRKNGNNQHIDSYECLRKYNFDKKYFLSPHDTALDTFNNGELCPNYCN